MAMGGWGVTQHRLFTAVRAFGTAICRLTAEDS